MPAEADVSTPPPESPAAGPRVRVVVTPVGWAILLAVCLLEGAAYLGLGAVLPVWFGPLTKQNPAGFLAGLPFFLTPVLWLAGCWVSGKLGAKAMFQEPM